MALQQIWKATAAAGREASAWGTAPTTTLPLHLGGSYVMLPINADVGLQSHIEKGLSEGRSGYREMYTTAPVVGNKRSEGGLQGDLLPDSAGILLYAALGAVTSTPVEDAKGTLCTDADISSDAGVLTITAPTSSVFLRFVITAAAGTAMSITVVGVDANGDTVTEVLPVTLATGAATVQTRHSFHTITSCTAAGFTQGAAEVKGYVTSGHVFTLAETPASYTVVNLGDSGRDSGEAGFYSGCVLKSVRFDIDASSPAARASYQSEWIGEPADYATAPVLYTPVDKPFAGWNAAVTVEGSAYYRVLRATLNLNPNNTLIWSADGSQSPHYPIGGQFAMTGQLVLVSEDETEWEYFANNTELNIEITLTNPVDKLDAATSKSLKFELTRTYFSNAQPGNHNGAEALTVDFITNRDSSDGALKATLTNAVYGY